MGGVRADGRARAVRCAGGGALAEPRGGERAPQDARRAAPALPLPANRAPSDLLLQTILSRCRIERLGALPTAQVAACLQARYPLPEATVQAIAAFSDGALGCAIRWAEALLGSENAPRELDALQALLGVFARLGQASLEDALRLAHEFREACKALEGGTESRSARAALALGLEYLVQWYRDALEIGRASCRERV